MTAPASQHIRVEIPDAGYHRRLISCQHACPVNTDARGYVRAIAEGRFEEAYLIARGANPFASICGRICGAPCELACRRGRIPRVGADGEYAGNDKPISIRALKRFVCEQAGPDTQPVGEVLDKVRAYVPSVSAGAEEVAALLHSSVRGNFMPARGEKIAIIGAGPAGLSAAHDLALMGFRPTVFEAEPVPAGMLYLGVPEYRLPRELIRREIAVIEAVGVTIRCGVRVGARNARPPQTRDGGREISFADLRRVHAAVIIAVGAKRSRSLNLPGEAGPHVYGGVDLLRAVALGEPLPVGGEVVVIGGGNVAYDVARTVLRQTASDAARAAARLPGTSSVRLVSLETLEEMPADTVEIAEGDEEGIERMNGWGPVEILRDAAGAVNGVVLRKCIRVYDEARRFAPEFDDTERRVVRCDTVLLAAGQSPDLAFLDDGGEDVLEARPGWPKVDAVTLATTAPGVYVAGDLAHGTRLLIDAVASGKRAARSVYRHVTGREIRAEMLEAHIPLARYRREPGYETIRRAEIPTRPPAERLDSPRLAVEIGFDATLAIREASRCLDCGVTPVFDGTRCVLCGGCVDVCPTSCLKLVSLAHLESAPAMVSAIERALGPGADLAESSAILKDEDRCIRCALCEMRCPVAAITMERVTFQTSWSVAS